MPHRKPEDVDLGDELAEAMGQPETAHHTPNQVTYTAASVAKALVAGGVAGGLSRTAVAPLERLKILMQVQNTAAGRTAVYRGTWQGLVYMARHEGLRGMFKGNGANCLRIVPNSAVKFLTYEHVSRLILQQRRAASADAELTALSATYPLDMVRGRLTVQADGAGARYSSLAHAVRTIAAEEGPRAFYKGWLPSVIGVVPYVGLNFAVYESLKGALLAHRGLSDERQLGVWERLAAGAAAGSVGQTVAYPLDVVRRRLQVAGWSAGQVIAVPGAAAAAAVQQLQPSVPRYAGMVDCFVQTVRHEGVGALFKGLLPNYVKVCPSIAIAFVSYEKIKEALGVDFRISD